MKKIILLALLISFSPSMVSAYGEFDLGGKYNPINVQIQQDPAALQRQENQALESQLSAQYGYSVVASCKSSVCNKGNDVLSDPYAIARCLLQVSGDLRLGWCPAQRQQQQNSAPIVNPTCQRYATYINGSCQCNSGYVAIGSMCQSSALFQTQEAVDLYCKNTYGTNTRGTGYNQCDCVSGYVWTADKKSCIVQPTKTNDQLCQDSYGVYSNWDGTKNNSGGLNCGCKNGYSWNSGQTACVILPPKTNEEICQSINGVNSTVLWLNETNGNPICGCKKGYEWATGGKSCKLITTYPPASGGGGGGGGSVIVPKTNSVQNIDKQEPVKKDILEEKKPEVVKVVKTEPDNLSVEKIGFWRSVWKGILSSAFNIR